jgi:hypothetical protein
VKRAKAYKFYELGYLQSLKNIKEGGTYKCTKTDEEGNEIEEILNKFDAECVDNILFEAQLLLRDFISNEESEELPAALDAAQALHTEVTYQIGRLSKYKSIEPGDLHATLSKFETLLEGDLTRPTRPLIAASRLAELRALAPSEFDFKKLLRLCEEINQTYEDECYFATAMLTRALIDHVPPLFGKDNFEEVANNYAGGGRSFKEAMLHLEKATKKISDGLLHTHIRKSETLPVAQEVNCADRLDLLLSEIVRITSSHKGKNLNAQEGP